MEYIMGRQMIYTEILKYSRAPTFLSAVCGKVEPVVGATLGGSRIYRRQQLICVLN